MYRLLNDQPFLIQFFNTKLTQNKNPKELKTALFLAILFLIPGEDQKKNKNVNAMCVLSSLATYTEFGPKRAWNLGASSKFSLTVDPITNLPFVICHSPELGLCVDQESEAGRNIGQGMAKSTCNCLQWSRLILRTTPKRKLQ